MPQPRRRLLMLTHRVPYPPDRGDRIRSWNMLRHLSQRFDISLGCVSEEPLCPQTMQKLQSVCRNVCIAPIGGRSKWLRAGASAARGGSLTEGLFWSPTLCKTIDRWVDTESFDAVLVYCSGMLRYARRKGLRKVPRFVDLVDVDSQKFYEYAGSGPAWKRRLYRTEGKRVRKLEHEAVRSAIAVTLVSDAEAIVLRDTLEPGEHPIHGIRNGVDTEYFAPRPNSPRPNSPRPNSPLTHSLLTHSPTHLPTFPRLAFVGVMNYPPNVEAIEWFVRHVWPHLRQRHPDAHLDVVGKRPTAAIESLGQRPGIHVTGSVPDVRPFVHDADIVIAPLQIARGIQNKVLEAMSMARPVLASPVAVTGIDAVEGQHLMIAHTPEQWLERIDQLCSDRPLRDRLAAQARDLICRDYTWQTMLRGMDRLLGKYLDNENDHTPTHDDDAVLAGGPRQPTASSS